RPPARRNLTGQELGELLEGARPPELVAVAALAVREVLVEQCHLGFLADRTEIQRDEDFVLLVLPGPGEHEAIGAVYRPEGAGDDGVGAVWRAHEDLVASSGAWLEQLRLSINALRSYPFRDAIRVEPGAEDLLRRGVEDLLHLELDVTCG